MKKITFLDTSLRDGAQGEGIAFSDADRQSVCEILEDFGIDFIEVPAVNAPQIRNIRSLTAFGATRKANLSVDRDPNIALLVAANTDTVTIFGKAWDLHVEKVLKCELSENLRMIEETIDYFKRLGKRVILDLEHFFDGYLQTSNAYARAVLDSSTRADIVALCDTNGGAFPPEVSDIVREITKSYPDITFGVHFHNDRGMAVANTMAGVIAGASHVQGTFIGTGERCGNADLSTVICNLRIGCNMDILSSDRVARVTPTARTIAEISNVRISPGHPYVGRGAFAHKAGMHIDGMLKFDRAFEHVAPERVGNTRRYLTSDIAGRALVLHKIRQIFPNYDISDTKYMDILQILKANEALGYQYEGADASFELVIRQILSPFQPFFELIYYRTLGEDEVSTATIKIRVGDQDTLAVGEGVGPVNALDGALRNALENVYPTVTNFKLIDYKVRVLDSRSGTASKVRVLLTSSDGRRQWSTVGVSEDIIRASWLALCDSFVYYLVGE